MAQEVHIVATLAPKADKVDRFKDLMSQMCKDVHAKEEGSTHRYILTEQLGTPEGEPKFVMVETYKDKNAADSHTQTDHFKQLFGVMEKEGLLREGPWLAQTVSKAGFERDRKLI
ncbi:uncharacterized protein LTR77_002174 [Saxophila tyrrhenica]|uniref:ABM domain-containing protein n=1 Tax=Saxophila tyrrhenica TaxID=1690608 RepID=A0AAV9PIP6_9PEZI|nr:hypothetical protein LTR77_002174 [Saxophila tyrrhenica]